MENVGLPVFCGFGVWGWGHFLPSARPSCAQAEARADQGGKASCHDKGPLLALTAIGLDL